MKLRQTSKFKKDLKRYQNRPEKIAALGEVLKFLETYGRVPYEYSPHSLRGNYVGCWECHIQNDFLLIWIDETTDEIKLLRLGTHSELFR